LRALKLKLPNRAAQDEVVSILDRFTEIIAGVQSGLPAEITARRRQYEYYRSKLLTFKELKA
jgi:type I restriction enzyme S subunit